MTQTDPILHPFDNPTATYDELVATGLPGCAVTHCFDGWEKSVMVTPEESPVLGVILVHRGPHWNAGVHGATTVTAATPRAAVLEAAVAWEVAGAVQILRRLEEVSAAMRVLRARLGEGP